MWALGFIAYTPKVMELCHFDNLISEVPGQNKLWERRRHVTFCLFVSLNQKSEVWFGMIPDI